MKTARFATVVESSGKPETNFLLSAPDKDKKLQAAIKGQRVMTVHQQLVGSKKDYGTIGFDPGPSRQYLIFPKSLSPFGGTKIVGVNFDLLAARPVPIRERAQPPKALARPPTTPKPSKAASDVRIVQFPKPEKSKADEVPGIKKQIRAAMKQLEQGRQVAAFNILKRIVGDS